jgi:parallel beta-helix repeat protein
MLPLLLLSAAASAAPDTVQLRAGLVITRSTVLRPAAHPLHADAADSAVIRVRGSDIVLDFDGAELDGSEPGTPPDQRTGYGVLIEGGRNITIRRAGIHGYKVGILARGVAKLVIEQTDVSDNWAPRLWSGIGHESLADWLYYHHNERDEWLRYGAGIYLADVSGGIIRGNTATGGQNGLLLARSEGLRIYNNTFSWLSGLGVGLYRSSSNLIMHNRLDWCIRGYVHGVYSRGQDSAALLLYEQSSNNTIAYNSMTHSGDGLFLWAGQSTMDTGAGGANDNLFFGNDVSFAATNGIEATFSRNRFIGNRIEGAQYGVWGGYSYSSVIRSNSFSGNVVGIAVEHGQDNRIVGNRFDRDRTAIRLWANALEPSDWGYPKHRDTRSRDTRIEGNVFTGNRVGIRLENTGGVNLVRNQYERVDTLLVAAGTLTGLSGPGSGAPPRALDGEVGWRPDHHDPDAPAPLPDGIEPWMSSTVSRGRGTIRVDEWGPYDGRYPRLWPARLEDSAWTGGPLALVMLGPPGQWHVTGMRGVASLSAPGGAVGDSLLLVPAPGPVADVAIDLEYRGGAVRAPGGARVDAGAPFRFRFERFASAPAWDVRVFAWDSTTDPRAGPEAFARLLRQAPVSTLQTPVLDWMWYRPRVAGIPAERFAVEAVAAVELPEGSYEVAAISDDGIRVWVDDAMVIDRWESHESVVDRAPLRPGRHRLRVAYYQVDGWVELRLEIRKR